MQMTQPHSGVVELANTLEMQIKFFHKVSPKTAMNEECSNISLQAIIFKYLYNIFIIQIEFKHFY